MTRRHAGPVTQYRRDPPGPRSARPAEVIVEHCTAHDYAQPD